jgi:hypothetical protein
MPEPIGTGCRDATVILDQGPVDSRPLLMVIGIWTVSIYRLQDLDGTPTPRHENQRPDHFGLPSKHDSGLYESPQLARGKARASLLATGRPGEKAPCTHPENYEALLDVIRLTGPVSIQVTVGPIYW